jgi:hypothetical protein
MTLNFVFWSKFQHGGKIEERIEIIAYRLPGGSGSSIWRTILASTERLLVCEMSEEA